MTSSQLASSSSPSSSPSSLSSLRSMARRQPMGENVIARPKPVSFPNYSSCSSNILSDSGTKDVGNAPSLLKMQQQHSHSPLTISHLPRLQNLKATPVLSIAHAHAHAETSSSASLLSSSSSSRSPDSLVSLIPFPASLQQQQLQQAPSSLCRLASEREPEDPDTCTALSQNTESSAKAVSTSSLSTQTTIIPSYVTNTTNTPYAHPLLPRRRAQSGFTPSVLPPAHHHRAKRARISSAASGIPIARRRLSSASSPFSSSYSSSSGYSQSGTGTGNTRSKRLPATDMELLAGVYRAIVWHDLSESESAMDVDEVDEEDVVFINAKRRRELSMLSRSLAERLHTTLTERKCRPALLRVDNASFSSSSSSLEMDEEMLAKLVAKLLLRYHDRSAARTGRMSTSSAPTATTGGGDRRRAAATVRASSPLSSSSTMTA
jgi:hypothetical protein